MRFVGPAVNEGKLTKEMACLPIVFVWNKSSGQTFCLGQHVLVC